MEIDVALPEGAAWLIAEGSGVIHDIMRYTANKREITFISYPASDRSIVVLCFL